MITRFARGDRVMESMETLTPAGTCLSPYDPMTPSPSESPRFLLHEITRGEAARRAPRALVVLPVGATEQHGPHLPLGTDFLIVEHVARAAARRAQPQPRRAGGPHLQTGSSHHHLPFGGNLAGDRAVLRRATRHGGIPRREWIPSHLHRQWTRGEPRAHRAGRPRPCLVAPVQPRRRVVLGSRQRITRAACARFGRAPAGSCWRLRDLADHGTASGPGRQPTAPPHRGGPDPTILPPAPFVPNVTASGRVSTALPIARTRPARSGGSVCSRSSLPRSRQRSSALRACR